jgi:L,D-transpeptidase ErfK/SrfK
MFLNDNRRQNSGKQFFIDCFLISILLSGCQSSPNHFVYNEARIPYDSIATNEFALVDGQDLVGVVASIQSHENDTLPDIARHFGLGYNDIIIANPHLDPWLPEPGNRVILPLLFIIPDVQRDGIVLNLASMRLFHFPAQPPARVLTYPIGIGRKGWNTPTGSTTIIAKKKNPAWHVPASILREHVEKGNPLPRIVPAGPDNPLGDYAMRLGFSGYLIHGTNKPYGVGMQISHGCVRLYPEDIDILFQQTSTGTKVRIIDQPYLLGWNKEMLFLEAHPLTQRQRMTAKDDLFKKLQQIPQQYQALIDWPKIDSILKRASGIPTPILTNSTDFYSSIVLTLPSLTRPQRFDHQPVIKPLTSQDWSIKVATFNDANAAQKLVALLNHQGPPIPSRRVQEADLYHVVAGPFHSEEEVQSVIVNIQREFQLTGIAQPPQTNGDTQQTEWSRGWLFGEDKRTTYHIKVKEQISFCSIC